MEHADEHSLRNAIRDQGLEVDDRPSWAKLIDKLISTFVEPGLIQPTFLMDYPIRAIAPGEAKAWE